SFAAPFIKREWSVNPALLGIIFSASLVGAILGAAATSALGKRVSRRSLLAACLLWFAAGSAATIFAGNTTELLVCRLLTGIGLGAAIPLTLATIAESIPLSIRARSIAFVIGGIPFGGILAGLTTASLAPEFGWRATFLVGAIMPLVIAPIIWFNVRESVSSLVRRGVGDDRIVETLRRSGVAVATGELPSRAMPRFIRAPFRELVRGGYARSTIPVLVAILFGAVLGYFLTQWVPALLRGAGSSEREASIRGAYLNAGAIGAILTFGYLMDRWGVIRVTAFGYACAIPMVALLGQTHLLGNLIDPVLVLAGLFGVGSQVGTTAIVATRYPSQLQVAMGSLTYISSRLGAILGPLVAGFLLYLGLDRVALFYVMCIPPVVVLSCVLLLRDRPADATGV
ncbi:MFS transporter, partial [uncultured Sphingomonas sp.]|uniref:MFS transporter n=1 Tax=uncultured Sphingomonas sp. TaxID=158754 RepID=UPI0035CA10EC